MKPVGRKPTCYCGVCSTCKKREQGRRWRLAHPDDAKERSRRFRAENPEGNKRAQDKYRLARGAKAYRAYTLKSKFGISLEEYDRLFVEQGGVCARCSAPETGIEIRTGRRITLAVDHCHYSAVVRSLLCRSCNQRLGFFESDLDRLRGDLRYLIRHRSLAVRLMVETIREVGLG
jgi:hypothetical protein